MASLRKAIAMLATGLVCFSLLLAVFTAYAWLMLGGESLCDAFIAAVKLLSGFIAALVAAASFNVAWRRCVSAPSETGRS
ncbi:UNVERIFIED_ORG: magnesium-transporting ATPase (P-type) [Stenotrophomonas maltophilia]|nr:magnesium-transporting ATPase (P-type) [Stenotrophomonas maltophilia]